jgi:FHS family glucose/mannose:H+ symporter-like MFS transporter
MPSFTAFQETNSSRSLTLAAHAAFVPTGVVTILLGPLLPTLSSRWSLSDAQAGYLFTAQFTGSTLGVWLYGLMVRRLGFRLTMVAGLVMMALGVAILATSSWPAGLACVFGYGLGLGVTIPAANLAVAQANPRRRGSALNLLNFSWSVGAVACPFLVTAFVRSHRIALFLYVVATMLGVVSALIARRRARELPADASGHEENGGGVASLQSGLVVMLALIFFLYVGMENAIGGWSASYAKRVSVNAGTAWVMTPSLFYGAMLLGRGLAPLVLRHVEEVRLARAGLLLALLGGAGLLFSHTVAAVMADAALAGLGMSVVYPITVSVLAHKVGKAAPWVDSLMFALGNVGGATLPWLVGYCSTQFSSLKAGLVVPLITGVVLLGLYLNDWRVAEAGPGPVAV